jgi:hypothetical protein
LEKSANFSEKKFFQPFWQRKNEVSDERFFGSEPKPGKKHGAIALAFTNISVGELCPRTLTSHPRTDYPFTHLI